MATRPYVIAAMLCQQVLEEKNGTISVIRVADRMGYQTLGLPEGARPVVQLSGFVSLKSGPVTGDHMVKIVAERPSGVRTEIYTWPVAFMGKDHGQNLIVNMTLGIEEDGLYWFDVIFDDEVLTKIPLMVAQESTPAPTPTAPQS